MLYLHPLHCCHYLRRVVRYNLLSQIIMAIWYICYIYIDIWYCFLLVSNYDSAKRSTNILFQHLSVMVYTNKYCFVVMFIKCMSLSKPGPTCNISGPCVFKPCNMSNTKKCHQNAILNTTDVQNNYTCECMEGKSLPLLSVCVCVSGWVVP